MSEHLTDASPGAAGSSATATGTRFAILLCPERSGSTLLAAMLAGHPRVIAPAELHLLRFATVEAWQRGYPVARNSLNPLLEFLHMDPTSIPPEQSPVDLYRAIAARAPADGWLVEQTPAYARSAEALRAAESLKPHYIWLLRHPLGVAASREDRHWSQRRAMHATRARLKYPGFWLRETWRGRRGRRLREYAEDWAGVHRRVRDFLAGIEPSRQHRLHYESLVRDPGATLRGLCAFLQIDFQPSMLEPQAHAPAELRWSLGDEKLLRHEGISARRADAWRARCDESLLPPDVEAFAREIGALSAPTASV